jgi:hypothetical protein
MTVQQMFPPQAWLDGGTPQTCVYSIFSLTLFRDSHLEMVLNAG